MVFASIVLASIVLQCIALHCNTRIYNTIQCNPMQCNAMQCNTILQYNITIQYYNTIIQYNITIQYYNTIIQYNITIQYYNTIIQYNITIQYYNITADLLRIICRHAAFILNSSTSETATRTAPSSCTFETIPPHLIPFSLQKRLILPELKRRCSGYVVSKTSAKSSTVFSFLDKNSLIKLSCSSRAAIV